MQLYRNQIKDKDKDKDKGKDKESTITTKQSEEMFYFQ
jgi:hypothetical protein